MNDHPSDLSLEMLSAITFYMREQGITRENLAKRLNVNIGRISQVLSGSPDITLRTLETVADALGADVDVTFKPRCHD